MSIRAIGRVCAMAVIASAIAAAAPLPTAAAPASASSSRYEFNDSHFHLTNYVQEGIDIHRYLKLMGHRVGRSTLFGIPLQQQWSYRVSGTDAPTYYLDTDARLYYYSFTDAAIAMAYKSLSKSEQARFDPMITGFNPTDMYAADHIRRVLLTFPGVFSGIGEFSIHKEFVSSKIAGDIASLTDPALDRLLDFAAEVGLVCIIHNDVDRPYPRKGETPKFLAEFKDLLKRHPKNSIIWAHVGVGRVVQPVSHHLDMLEDILEDPACVRVSFDLSWDETAKYVISSPEATRRTADLINKYPDRFLFGTDNVAPADSASHFKVYDMYQPLWTLLTKEASEKVRKGNYERIFDEGRRNARAWEAAHLKPGR
ncbi:MAG TPA: amidohydrolase family protein [Candidatus Eisenbacteria bacterium]|nr:amidohydrolase family protein [Candidatus Eisenbacteria bacterium]